MDSIGKRLRQAREFRLMEQEELSEAANVGVATISRIENDRLQKAPRLSTLRRLADALNVDYGWLATGEDLADVKNAA